jgi:hypothetical protein
MQNNAIVAASIHHNAVLNSCAPLEKRNASKQLKANQYTLLQKRIKLILSCLMDAWAILH